MVSTPALSRFQCRLLDDWQRHFPLVSRPFQTMATELGCTSHVVLQQLERFKSQGTISRVGPVFRPNSIGVSTLAAVSVPAAELESAAAIISSFDAVNHNYEREHEFNLWFVATAAGGRDLQAALDSIEGRVGRSLLRLPLVKAYHIDLGFPLGNTQRMPVKPVVAAARTLSAGQRARQEDTTTLNRLQSVLIAEIQQGLPLQERPYLAVAERLGCTETDVIDALVGLLEQGVIKRLGVVVRHHELGYRANAMVVWDVPDATVDALGEALGRETDVTLCYRRPRAKPRWPYNLFCMIHGQDRTTVEALVASLVRRHGLQSVPHEVLFSLRRFKQRGARYRGLAPIPREVPGARAHG